MGRDRHLPFLPGTTRREDGDPMRTAAWVLGGWLAADAIFALGCWWGGRHRDDTCHNCEAAVDRLSAQLARESRKVAAQDDYIDLLEHEQAIDGGQALPDEVAQFLADQERGGS